MLSDVNFSPSSREATQFVIFKLTTIIGLHAGMSHKNRIMVVHIQKDQKCILDNVCVFIQLLADVTVLCSMGNNSFNFS